jgi:endonuclease YncB( thermonuclease family)
MKRPIPTSLTMAAALLLAAVLLVAREPALLHSSFGQVQTLIGTVVRVADGDTITVLDSAHHQYRIRLQGIDAPEKGQAFGNASRKHLADLVGGKAVIVRWTKHDRYGRIVGTVFIDDRDVDLEQVKTGMAWFYRYYQSELTPEDRKRYAQAEDEARAAKLGLWQDKNPMPPWEWRRLHR